MNISWFIVRDNNNVIDRDETLKKFQSFLNGYSYDYNSEMILIKSTIYSCLKKHKKADLYFIKSYVCKLMNIQMENFTYYQNKIKEIVLSDSNIIKSKYNRIAVYYLKE